MEQWKKAWGYLPIEWGTCVGEPENITQKLWIRNNINGKKARLVFSNRYSQAPLCLEAVTIGVYDRKTDRAGQIKSVTLNGNNEIMIPPGQELYSDEILINIEASQDLMISIYFGKKQKLYSVCQTWNQKGWNTQFSSGNTTTDSVYEGVDTRTGLPFFGYDENPCSAAAGICEVQLLTEDAVQTLVCLGDSITHMSYYFDPLQEILYQRFPGKITVVNAGIGGNRLLFDACFAPDVPGQGKCFGVRGIERFEKDVFGRGLPEYIFFMEGVNDCTHGFAFHQPQEVPDGEKLYQGLEKIIEKAHERGSKIFISTVMPFNCREEAFRKEAEKIRQEFNGYIREKAVKKADGFLDLDLLMRDPEDPHFMKPGLSLDGIHPNEIGGEKIAEAISESFWK